PEVQAAATMGQARACLHGQPSRSRLRAATALLIHGRRLATTYSLGLAGMQVTVLNAELHLRQGLLGEAQTAAEEVLHLGTGGKQSWEMALAHRLMGQCARARGLPPSAEEHLRAALALFVEMGAVLEAARTRAVLAEVLMAGPDPRGS